MTNRIQYNPAVYLTLRTGSCLLIIAGLITAGIVVVKSATGELYNPVFRFPAWLVNLIIDAPGLPNSIAEFKAKTDISTIAGMGQAMIGILYILSVSALTFYLITVAFYYVCNFIDDFALKYKLGEEGAAAYQKEREEKSIIRGKTAETISDLEKAQYEHYVQWKKYFKSELSYDEWKAIYSGVSNYKG